MRSLYRVLDKVMFHADDVTSWCVLLIIEVVTNLSEGVLANFQFHRINVDNRGVNLEGTCSAIWSKQELCVLEHCYCCLCSKTPAISFIIMLTLLYLSHTTPTKNIESATKALRIIIHQNCMTHL